MKKRLGDTATKVCKKLGTKMKNKSARVVSHGEGRALRASGDEIVIHLDGQDTHGTLTNVDCRVVGRRRIIT